MTQLAGEQSTDVRVRWLAGAACAFWLLSLGLPGFIVDTQAEPWFGIQILLAGLIFGWATHGWAVYANLIFVSVAVLLLLGRQPWRLVLAMLVLAATLPLFKGVARGEGPTLPVASWGWGAVAWVISLVLLAIAAAVRARRLAQRAVTIIFGLLLASVAGIGCLHFYQRGAANDQERSLYLRAGMAFMREPLCGVPLTAVTSPLLPRDSVVAFDVAPELVGASGDAPYLWLPTLSTYQEKDFAWTTLRNPLASISEVKVRIPTDLERPVLQARKSEQGAVLRLLLHPSGPILYEQRLKEVTSVAGTRRYCPMSTPGFSGLRFGYDTHVLRALGQDALSPRQESQAPNRVRLEEEVAQTPCSLGTDERDGVGGLRDWDGRQVIIKPDSLRSSVGLCSASYIALVKSSEHSDAGIKLVHTLVQLFDRKTLHPLTMFAARQPCPEGRCPESVREIAIGIRISDAEVVVETRTGEFSARR
jgi:hypothetical protein